MSSYPDPLLPQDEPSPEETPQGELQSAAPDPPHTDLLFPAEPQPHEPQPREYPPAPEPQSYFERYALQPIHVRHPNLLDLLLLLAMLLMGAVGSATLTALALHNRLFGVTTAQQALTNIHYTLGSEASWYLISFAGALLLFPAVWHTGFFRGVEWNAHGARRHLKWLFLAVTACILLAIADALLLPGPKEAPIDDIFRQPGAAWLLFAFGITLAPFFEELGFRGFLLPALCTAYDWVVEHIRHQPPPPPGPDGETLWSTPALIVGSLLTSVPFALVHGPQTGYSLGPFLLLVGVSLVLCWIRLGARSLAASTLVHAFYNLLLFTSMLLGTGGFRHLDKM